MAERNRSCVNAARGSEFLSDLKRKMEQCQDDPNFFGEIHVLLPYANGTLQHTASVKLVETTRPCST